MSTDTSNGQTVDFDELKRIRNKNLNAMVNALVGDFAKRSGSTGRITCHINTGGSTSDCYCDCAGGGPCQHEFGGWRIFEDGRGGEQVCSRCGMGAMSHTLHTGE